jgi:hypothetical protein
MRATLLACLGGLLFGCGSTCNSVCDKLLSCPELDAAEISDKECELDCAVQENAYENNEELNAAFEAYKDCVLASTCAQIAQGDCYSEGVFAF